jgi:hypothetical protein
LSAYRIYILLVAIPTGVDIVRYTSTARDDNEFVPKNHVRLTDTTMESGPRFFSKNRYFPQPPGTLYHRYSTVVGMYANVLYPKLGGKGDQTKI